MVGDRMVGSWSEVKWGTRSGWGSGVHPRERGEEPRSEGVRVLVVAKKFGNGDGAKEDRKVEGCKRQAGKRHRRQWPGESPSLRKAERSEPDGLGVEASVWTPRMVKALETGMGEGKWFRLIDKVWSEKKLQSALEQVVYNGGSAGVDGRSVAAVRKTERRRNRHLTQTTQSRER
jgi:hypothetical protein